MPQDAPIDGTKWIGDGPAGFRAETRGQGLTRTAKLRLDRRIIQPREPPMARAMRGELEAPGAPLLDLRPTQVLEAIPGVLHVPGIRLPDVVCNKEGGGSEAEVGENRIGGAGEGGVAVVEGQKERAWGVVRGAWGCEFIEGERPPASAGERRHLSRKDRPAHPSNAQLERAADTVIAENRGKCRQCHSHVKTAHVTSAKITPSNVDFSVMTHDRRYQIDIWYRAKV